MQAFNPYLPSYEYVPDAEPKVFGDRVYIYGSHDKFNGISFCLLDYVCWSAPTNDLSNWRYEGVIFQKKQAPGNKTTFINSLFAPDVAQGVDGRFYLYFFLGFNGYIGVAVCDTPCGKFEFLGKVKYADGIELGKKGEPLQFDPAIFVDDDGKVYLYTGFAPTDFPKLFLGKHKPTKVGAMVFELQQDMLTIKTEGKYICKTIYNSKDSDFEGHEFFEASSMRKFDGKYYFIYSSYLGHELCYAVSDKPDSDFVFGGTLVSNGDVGICDSMQNYTGNTHGSVVQINGQYYVFYHRQTNRNQFSRQACAEKISFEKGKFLQAEITSCGLNSGLLKDFGKYETRIACNLYSKDGAYFYGAFKKPKKNHPYFTQDKRDGNQLAKQYISNFCDGATCVFKYFMFENCTKVSVFVKGKGAGKLNIFANDKKVGQIEIFPTKKVVEFGTEIERTLGKTSLKFVFEGKGSFDFLDFSLA